VALDLPVLPGISGRVCWIPRSFTRGSGGTRLGRSITRRLIGSVATSGGCRREPIVVLPGLGNNPLGGADGLSVALQI
jgi:hypothetical protein